MAQFQLYSELIIDFSRSCFQFFEIEKNNPRIAVAKLSESMNNLGCSKFWTAGAEGDWHQILATFTSYILHYSDFYLCKFRNRSSHFGPDLLYCKARLSSKFCGGYPITLSDFE